MDTDPVTGGRRLAVSVVNAATAGGADASGPTMMPQSLHMFGHQAGPFFVSSGT